MAVREILIYPEDILKRKTKLVEVFDEDLKRLIDDMAETMYAAPGIGLAANQVGVDKQVAIVDIDAGEETSKLMVFVNPKIVSQEGEISWEEGCLSFPEILVDVQRSAKIRVQAQNVDGEEFVLDAEELLAVAIQHEMDHLNGQSLADKVGFLRKKMIIKELLRVKQSS